MGQEDSEPRDLASEPVSILFNPPSLARRNVWEIDIVSVLEMLTRILARADKRDLRAAGMAALTSSVIYRMKVDSIFALHKAAMEDKRPAGRRDVDIRLIDIPYRHETTYPVTLDELLGLLENLIGSLANPRARRGGLRLEPDEGPPDMRQVLIPIEETLGRYEELVASKIGAVGTGLLGRITEGLGLIDAIRCFFAVLFMARERRADLEQEGEDIRVTLVGPDNAPAGRAGPARG